MELMVVPYYAAVLGIGMILLSLRVIRLRRLCRIAVGCNGQPELERAVRVHGNYSEYVPLALILLVFVEINGAPDWIVHGLCGLLVLGRTIHALGMSRTVEDYRYRVIGMAATFTVLGVASMALFTGSTLLSGIFS